MAVEQESIDRYFELLNRLQADADDARERGSNGAEVDRVEARAHRALGQAMINNDREAMERAVNDVQWP